MIVLPDAEDRTIVSSFIWIKHRNVTDVRRDRPDRQTCRAITAIYTFYEFCLIIMWWSQSHHTYTMTNIV